MGSSLPASWPSLPGPKSVLCLGAHSDDIEIGCGGTLLTLADANPDMEVVWVVLASGSDERRAEAEASASRLLGDRVVDVQLLAHRERYLHYSSEVKEFFDQLGRAVDPALVLTPHVLDQHQDHRTVGELTWNTFRSHAIWEYEIVKYEGDLGQPNLYVPLSEANLDRKIEHLAAAFPSQADRYWFSEDTFRGLARIRGVECRAASGYAEAFHARKVVLT
ncbi:MAG: PIG-L deacetylase family protein [Acidimicrobiia bacterium]